MIFFRFEDPWLLLLLLLLALLSLRAVRAVPAIHYSSVDIVKVSGTHRARILDAIPAVLRFLAMALFIIAFARPQEGQRRTEIISQGVDIVLAIDTSGSMAALDFKKDNENVTRLAIVKDVVAEFIEKRQNDRVGMVVFGAEAFTQCPLTLDQGILFSFLEKLQIGMAGDATAVGSAIGISTRRLKDLQSKSKVIILLTDGRSNSGNLTPVQAAEIAKTFGIKIYTIGVGTQGKVPFMVDTVFGQRVVYQNVDMDEDTLKKIAEMTEAKYFRATDRESLKNIYSQIDQLEKSDVKVLDHSEYRELFHYFVLSGLFLLIVEVALSGTILRRVP